MASYRNPLDLATEMRRAAEMAADPDTRPGDRLPYIAALRALTFGVWPILEQTVGEAEATALLRLPRDLAHHLEALDDGASLPPIFQPVKSGGGNRRPGHYVRMGRLCVAIGVDLGQRTETENQALDHVKKRLAATGMNIKPRRLRGWRRDLAEGDRADVYVSIFYDWHTRTLSPDECRRLADHFVDRAVECFHQSGRPPGTKKGRK